MADTAPQDTPPPSRHWWAPALAVLLAAGVMVGGLSLYNHLTDRPLTLDATAEALRRPQWISVVSRRRSGTHESLSKCWTHADGRYRVEYYQSAADSTPTNVRVFDGERISELLPESELIRVRTPTERDLDRTRVMAPGWLFEPLPEHTETADGPAPSNAAALARLVELDFGPGRRGAGGVVYPAAASVTLDRETDLPLLIQEHFGSPDSPHTTATWTYDYETRTAGRLFRLVAPDDVPVVDLDAERARAARGGVPVTTDHGKLLILGLYCNEAGDMFVHTLAPSGSPEGENEDSEAELASTSSSARDIFVRVERVMTNTGFCFAGYGVASRSRGECWELLACLHEWDRAAFPASATVELEEPSGRAEGVPVTRLPGDQAPQQYLASLGASAPALHKGRLRRRLRALADRGYHDLAIPVIEAALDSENDEQERQYLQSQLQHARRELGLPPAPEAPED